MKDSHDKYANIETAYLLQKMEEYQGITVLATNLLNNIDEAFLRRINYVIKFPFPDSEYREKIWQSMFPLQRLSAMMSISDIWRSVMKLPAETLKMSCFPPHFLPQKRESPSGCSILLNPFAMSCKVR